jgi:DNA polymerase-3 subunit epsilon
MNNMRELILDTETTGLDPRDGHRIVEIACVEMINLVPTGQTYHVYLNPQRDMPDEAYRVHGLSGMFLKDKPLFADVYREFLDYISDVPLIIHNAEFDLKFLNFEIGQIDPSRVLQNKIIDTLILARKKFPGASNSLDALCARFKIDNSKRSKHNALLDSQILAEVYCELVGGRQSALTLSTTVKKQEIINEKGPAQQRADPLERILDPHQLVEHTALIESLGDKAIWKKFLSNID